MKTVKEVSELTGVSIRALHHYDAIGLLPPARVTEAGYRLYDRAALERLQTILLFRELQFPLKDIKRILDTPGFDPMQALADQIRLLEAQKAHLDTLILHAKEIQKKGAMSMDFSKFDRRELDELTAQAKAKWGKTDAWKEFEAKSANKSQDQQAATGNDLMGIFRELGSLRHLSPADAQVQAMIAKLQAFISDHYYTCTKQILMGLGQMYIAGDSMTDNIDAAGGEGTAQLAYEAIMIYCK